MTNWTSGVPKAALRSGYPPAWTKANPSAEEVATEIYRRIPFEISVARGLEWKLEKTNSTPFPIYKLQLRPADTSMLNLQQKGDFRHIHGLKFIGNEISFGIGQEDRLFVSIFRERQ